MQPKLLKYILDIESIIQEIEQVKTLTKKKSLLLKLKSSIKGPSKEI